MPQDDRLQLPDFGDQQRAVMDNITLPAQPSNPPTIDDVSGAVHLAHELLHVNILGKVNTNANAAGEIYKTKIVHGYLGHDPREDALIQRITGAMQESLVPLRNSIATLTTELRDVKAELQDVKAEVRGLKVEVQELRLEHGRGLRISAIRWNHSSATGPHTELLVVPFPNGEDPTKPPYNLPALRSAKAVDNLSVANRTRYHEHYYPDVDVPRRAADCKAAIRRAIGSGYPDGHQEL